MFVNHVVFMQLADAMHALVSINSACCDYHRRTKTWSRTLDRMPPTVEVEPSDDSMTDGSMDSMDGDTEDNRSPNGGDAEPQQVGLVRARSCPAL